MLSGTAHAAVQANKIDTVYLGGAGPDKPPVPRELPPQTPHFVGRQRELAEVAELLSSDDATMKIGLIVGAAGIGKTSFAVRCGQVATPHYPDGVLWTDLRGFNPVAAPADPAEVVSGFLRDLGVPDTAIPKDLDGMARRYRSWLYGKRVLIILDNARDPDQVRPLLPGTPTCGVLVTSRNSMTSLITLGARRWTLNVLSAENAINLLGRFTNGQSQRQRQVELARLCAYHPLALCIAGARSADGADAADEVLRELRVEPLTSLSDPDDAAASLRAVFSWSYQKLPSNTRETFRLLGLYPGPTISAEVARVLTHDGDGIRRLLDGHLLERAGSGRYRFHDLFRAYAMERATESEPLEARTAALRRVLEWFVRNAERYDRAIDPWRPRPPHDDVDNVDANGDTAAPPDRAEAEKWFDAELPNIAAIVEAAAEKGEYVLAARLALAPSAYFYGRKPWGTWIAVQETGRSAARSTGDRVAEAWLCDGLGVAYREQGRRDDALRDFDIALRRFREHGDQVGEAESTLHLAQTHRELGRLDHARELSDRARSLFRAAGAEHGEAKASNMLGGIYLELGDPAAALSHTEHAAAIFEQLGDEFSHAWAVNNLAAVLAKLGRMDEAIAEYRTAMEVRQRIDRYGLAFTLQGLGDVLTETGEHDQAREQWRRALVIFDELGDPRAAGLRTRLAR